MAAPSTAFGGPPPPRVAQGRIARVAFAIAALTLAAVTVQAQTFLGVGVAGHPAPPPPPPPKMDAPAPASATPVLRFLPSTLDGLRLSGEIGDLRWPVYLTPAQATAPVRVRVGYLSAVSDLPEASSLAVVVNGHVVGTDVIDAAQGLKSIAFDVPADLLRPGYNEVAVTVRQRHRVDCSVAATYELWTRIEPTATGLELPAAVAEIADVADLPALLPAADGSMPIHIVLAGKTNPPHVQRLVHATQAIALKGRFLQPAVSFAVGALDPYGLDLVLGTRAALAQLPRLAGLLGASGPLVKLVPAPAGGRPTLVLSGSDDAEVDQAIAALDATPPALGSPQGLRVAENYPARKAGDGEALRLHSFGIESQEFSGRLFRKSLNIELPADFLASDYGRGTFDLAGGYAAGLAAGSQVRIDVNGRSAGIIKLPYADGDVFRHNQLFLPLGLMRPGFNRIDIFAETPRPADAACLAPDTKRFLFLDASELRLPALAHVERSPELAATTGGALPFARGTAHLVVPKPDRDTMAAALSLTTRIAVAAGHTLPFVFATRMPASDDGSTLVVSAARALDPAVMSAIDLDPASVEAAWADATPAAAEAPGATHWWQSNGDGPAACRLPPRRLTLAPGAVASARPIPASLPAPSATGESNDFIETWTAERRAGGWRATLGAASARVGDWFAATGRLASSLTRTATADAGIPAEASLILAEGVTGGDGNVTTIVTAADAGTLRAAVGCLFDPQVWSKVHGRLATLDASTGAVTATEATAFHYRASGTASLGNFRLVLAGWFSLNPIAFVLLTLLTAACLSGTTFVFVRGIGRRPE